MIPRRYSLQTASKRPGRASVIALCLVLAACTTASDEQEVIRAFSTATGTATQALKTYDEATAARETAKVRTKAVSDPGGVITLDERGEECATSSQQCQAFYKAPDDANQQPLTVRTLIPNHIAAANAIAAYAAALKEVADADARPQVGAALDKATAAVGSLANLVQPGSGAGLQAIAGPSASALTWLYGKYQEEVKMNALRDATQKMNPIMQEAAGLFGDEAELAVVSARAAGAQALDDAKDAFSKTPSTATINGVATATEAFDQQLKAPARMVFNSLAETHQMITTALVERPKSLEGIYTALSKLVADAATLSGIARDLKAAVSASSSASQ
jgi:hypothetical protein